MRILDIRRHTMRRKPGAHLSQDGIDLAHLIGQQAPAYALVVTSTIPRAIETAIAMGFEVHDTIEALGHLHDAVMDAIGWPKSFAQVSEGLAASTPAREFAQAQASLWRTIAERLPDGAHGLIVTHGLFIELGTPASLPAIAPESWGGPIGYCEGIRLTYDNGCQHGEILRVPAQHQLIDN